MRIASRALGQAYPGQGVTAPSSCGENPCAWYDYLYVTDDCAEWLQCAGQPAVTLGSELASGASYFTGALASGVGGAVSGVTSNATTDVVLAVVAIAAVGIWILLDKL